MGEICLDDEKLAKSPSNDRQIIKSRLSPRRRGKSLRSAMDSAHHWTRFECYLGNVEPIQLYAEAFQWGKTDEKHCELAQLA